MFGEQGMEHAEEYTYLGLVFHRSLGRTGGSGRLGKRDRFEGKEFYDGDTKEARVVVDIFDDEEYGWIANTAVINDGATTSPYQLVGVWCQRTMHAAHD